VSCLAVSDDFEYIYSGGFDNIIKKWKASDGSELGIFSGHNDCIMSLLLIDSNTLVSAARESTIRVWDTDKGRTIKTLVEHSGSVNWIAGDEDGKLIASASEDCSICIWRSDTWNLRGKLQGHSKSVNIVKINKTLLISASSDKTIILWNLPSMTQISILSGHNDYIKTIAVSYDARLVASGSADKTIRVWSTITRNIIGVLQGHTGEVNKVEISHDGKFIVSAGNDKTVRIWSIQDLQQEAVLYGNFDVIYELALTYDSRYLVSAFHDGSLRIYNIHENRQEAVLSGHTDGIKSLQISKDGRYIISGSDDKSIKLWDTTNYFYNCSIAQTCSSPALYGTQYPFRSARFVDAIISGFASSSPEVWMNDMMIVPYKLNVLHVLCYYNIPDKLRSALNDGCPIVINDNGETPLSIALNRRSQNSIDVLLEYVIELSSQDMHRMRAVVQILSQDMCSLMKRGSSILGNFLDVVFVASEPSFEVPKYSLPQYYLTDSRFIQKENIVIKLDNTNSLAIQENEEVLVEFKTSFFNLNFESGSYESLNFLTSIQECTYRNILTSDFISSLIEMKWDSIWIYVLIQSLFYWLNLAVLTYLLLNSSSFLALVSFLVLNSLFLNYEIFQIICMRSEYFKDAWNYLDIVRLVAGFSWAILGYYNISYMPLSWVITLIFWIRGLTYFRTFRYTRFFVRMILECVKDSFSFMIILLYSTLAVASLYVVSNPGLNSMADAFELSYQVNMGEFSNDKNNLFQWICFFSATILNCIIMLNLLISILGDSFEKSQMMAREADILEMLDLVIELEYLMIWKRNQGRKQHLQRCTYAEQSQLAPVWEGRIKAIEKKLMNISNEFNDSILNLQTTLLQALETQSNLTSSNLLKHLQVSQQNFKKEMLQTLTSKLSSRTSRSNLIT
jgi:WD40 repeat protein